jgi:hypothetical protein
VALHVDAGIRTNSVMVTSVIHSLNRYCSTADCAANARTYVKVLIKLSAYADVCGWMECRRWPALWHMSQRGGTFDAAKSRRVLG